MIKDHSENRGPDAFLKRSRQDGRAGRETLQDRAVAEIQTKVLTQNFRAISNLVPGMAILPMVKANAYGHGVLQAAKAWLDQAELYGFGVATFAEGIELRAALGTRHRKIKILVFAEATPWGEEKGHISEAHHLTPVLLTDEDWKSFYKKKWMERISYELQFNTGMNRLGLTLSMASSISKALSGMNSRFYPTGVSSHLAESENPNSRLSQFQLDRFKSLRRTFCSALPGVQFHLANSGAIWNHDAFEIQEWTDIVRPGISLYGVPPWSGAPSRGIAPAMTLKARVMGVSRLKPGDSIGYGGHYRVRGKEPIYSATVALGYADGILRGLGDRGRVWLNGHMTRFLGRISMDVCAIECQENTRVGSWAEFLGPNLDAWTQAQAAGTIPYELFTSVSQRVKRNYDANA